MAPDGNILTANDTVNGNWSYTYDDFGRISTSSKTGLGFNYKYDRYGNRWQQNLTAGSGPTPLYSFDANNHIATGNGVLYDAAGNISNDGVGHTYTYDAEGRLLTVNGTAASYMYDALGQRVRTTVGANVSDYIYDQAGRAVTNIGGGTWSSSELYAGGNHIATYSGGTTNFDHKDWLGTVRAHSGVTGSLSESCTSLPFGDGLSCSGTEWSLLHFTADPHDWESNLEHTLFRQLTTTEGRWITPDPAGLGAVDPANPQTWNRYAYVANNPLSATDPLGLFVGDPYSDFTSPDDSGSGGGFFEWARTCAPGALNPGMCSDSGDDETHRPDTPRGGGFKAAANNGKSICSGAAGKTIPVNAPFGQMRFQFDGSGNLIGLGLQLTGMNGVSGNGLSIPPNTFAGFTQLSPGTVQFGFSNPVNVGSGFSQAYVQTATFSGGRYTSVQGAYAPLGIPLGSSSGNSSLLQWFLNGNSSTASQAQNFGNLMTSFASLVSRNVSCQAVFGGG